MPSTEDIPLFRPGLGHGTPGSTIPPQRPPRLCLWSSLLDHTRQNFSDVGEVAQHAQRPCDAPRAGTARVRAPLYTAPAWAPRWQALAGATCHSVSGVAGCSVRTNVPRVRCAWGLRRTARTPRAPGSSRQLRPGRCSQLSPHTCSVAPVAGSLHARSLCSTERGKLTKKFI